MTLISRKLTWPGLLFCMLLITSCEEEPVGPEAVVINGGTIEVTNGYYTTTTSELDGKTQYKHHFLLISDDLKYDTVKLDYSGRGDMCNFTLITSTPELADGTYSIGDTYRGEEMEIITFMRDFYRVHNPDPEAIENLYTDYFDKLYRKPVGEITISVSGDVYTFNFNFSKYQLSEDSDKDTQTEVNGVITGSYTGTLKVWDFPW